MHKSGGFTIVEIIIVCIVLGILVTIGTVSWAGSLVSGRDRTRNIEQQDWVKRYDTYRNRYNVYPNTSSTGVALNARYCLGTAFPSNTCAGGSIATSTNDAAPNTVMTELTKVGTLPDYKHSLARGNYVGPWADYTTSTRIRIYQAYEGESCPAGTTIDTTYSGATVCYIELAKN